MTSDAPRWVDLHCHLDLYPKHSDILRECEGQKIATLAVTTTPRAWKRNCEVAGASKYVRVALGLHPQLVAERADEFSIWEKLLPEARYVGEVGLDAGPRFYHSLPRQIEVFRKILVSCAAAGGKILTVHSVRSVPKTLELIGEHLPQDRGRVVLHWFTGTKGDMRRALAAGCYFSVNSAMLRSDRGRDLIVGIPVDRLLSETDGPFNEAEGRPVAPTDIPRLVDALAELRGLASEQMRTQLLKNLRVLTTISA